MARNAALLTLALFSDASLAFSDPLFDRQIDPSTFSTSRLGTAALSTGLVSSVASGLNASSTFSILSLSTGAGVSGVGTTQLGTGASSVPVESTSTALSSSIVDASSTASSAGFSATFPSLSVSPDAGLTGSGTGTAIVPGSSSVASNSVASSSVASSSVASSSVASSSAASSTVSSEILSSTIISSTFPSLSVSSDSGVTGSGTGTGVVPIPSSSSRLEISSTTASQSASSSAIESSSSAVSSGSSAPITSSTASSSVAPSSGASSSVAPSSGASSSVVPSSVASTDAIVTPSTTITSLPTGGKLESITGSVTWTTDEWITTTSSGDSSSTVVPIIFPLISGVPAPVPIIIWGGIIPPTIAPPAIQLKLPELGCIKFLGIKIGKCDSDNNDDNNDDATKSEDPSKSTEVSKSTEQSSSSQCSSKTATFTTIECSSAGTSSACETKTSETVGCSVTGSMTSSGSCVASTTVASSTICCSSTTVKSGSTICAFETLSAVANHPLQSASQTSLGTAKLLEMLGAYYSSYGASDTANNGTRSSGVSSQSAESSAASSGSLPASASASSTAAANSSSVAPSSTPGSSASRTPLSTLKTSYVSLGTPSSSSAAPSSTPAPPVCSEGNNELMGFNNEPASWCFCGNSGPFSTLDKATTNYCDFSTRPTKTISLTSHSTSIDTACHVSTTTMSAQTTGDTFCKCGNVIAGIGTSTVEGGTMLVGCQLSPTWSIISTITPSPTPTSTPEPPKAPYADAGGKCHIHVNELSACAEEDEDLNVEVTMWDVGGAQIGYQALTQANDKNPLKMKSKLEALLEVTAEHRGDYIQYTLGTESWTSKDNDKSAGAYCDTGGWDPKENPWNDPFFSCQYGDLLQKKQMDCYFECPWHGGASSDA